MSGRFVSNWTAMNTCSRKCWTSGTAEDVIFKVRADDGNVYILRHETSELDADWSLISFRLPCRFNAHLRELALKPAPILAICRSVWSWM